MSVQVPTNLVLINTTNNSGTITLPSASQISGRVITFKDSTGTFAAKPFTLQTTSPDTFEDGTTTRVFNETYGTIQVAASGTKWYVLYGTQLNTFRISTLNSLATNISSINGQTVFGPLFSTSIGLTTIGSASASSIATFTSNTSNVYSPLLLNNYSTNLTSTVTGLGSAGYISSAQLLSTTSGLQIFISTFIDPSELTSTVIGLGSFGYFSTIGVYSTVTGIYNFIQADIGSTIVGLGTAGFVSSIGLDSKLGSTTSGLLSTTNTISNSLPAAFSSLATFTSNTSNFYAPLLSNNLSSGFSTIATFTSNTSNFYANLTLLNISSSISSASLSLQGQINSGTSSLAGQLSAGLSTVALFTSNTITSTVAGLGNTSYISSSQLASTTRGIQTYVSTFLGTNQGNTTGAVLYLNYSTSVGSYKSLGITTTSNGLSRVQQSVPQNTTANAVAQFETDFTLPNFIPSGIWDVNVFATSANANVSIYAELYTKNISEVLIATSVNAPDVIDNTNLNAPIQYAMSFAVPYTNLSTGTTVVLKLLANGGSINDTLYTYYENGIYSHTHTTFGVLIPENIVQSTVVGLGTYGYISSAQFALLSNYLSPALLNNLSTGLSTTARFTSNTSNFFANALLANNLSTGLSTVAAFTSNTSNWTTNILQNWSTPVSTVAAFTSNTSNWSRSALQDFSTPLSTVALFASNNNPSSFSTAIATNFYTLSATLSSASIRTFSTLQASISSLQVNSIQFGTGLGFVLFPPIQTLVISSIQANTTTTYTVSTLLGATSSQTAIQFYGLNGTYQNTAVAEQSIGTGTQELLFYKGSTTSDRIRLNTTGSIVFEPGSGASIWPSAPANVTPAMVLTTASNVGIGMTAANVGSLLDVAGQGRFVTLSTQQTFTSSVSLNTINLIDSSNAVGYSLRVSSALLYYSSFVIGGARTMMAQTFAF